MNRRQMLVGGGALAALGGSAVYLAALGMGNSSEYAKEIASSRAPLADPALSRDLIRFATLAPNGHNTQPWKFRVRDQRIDILPDFSRRTPVVDPD